MAIRIIVCRLMRRIGTDAMEALKRKCCSDRHLCSVLRDVAKRMFHLRYSMLDERAPCVATN